MRPEENPVHQAQTSKISNAFLLLRHEESDLNAKALFPSLDVLLKGNWLDQVRSIRLPMIPDWVISSHLFQAIDIAQEIATSHNLSQERKIDTLLGEKQGAVVEGLSTLQIQVTYPDIWNTWDLKNKLDIAEKSRSILLSTLTIAQLRFINQPVMVESVRSR